MVQLPGPPFEAEQYRDNALEELRPDRNNGEWRNFHVASPSGAPIRLFVGPDSKPKQRATISLGKMLADAFKETLPQYERTDFHLFKCQARISLKWQHLAEVVPHRGGPCDINWLGHFRAEDKERVEHAFQQRLESRRQQQG